MTLINHPETLIVGDDELLREGLSLLLQSADYAVSGSLSRFPDCIDCDLLIVCPDGGARILSGMGCIGRMPTRTKLVVLMSRGTGAGLHADMLARAAGILNRASSPEKLLIALQAVLAGVMVHDATLLDIHNGEGEVSPIHSTADGPILLARGFPTTDPSRDTFACNLSLREREILSSLAEGNSNKVIARKHNITEATVKVHVRHILRKLNFSNRTQAALWAKEFTLMTA